MFKQMKASKVGEKSLRPRMSKQRSKRVRNLVIVCALIATVLSVSTYAWFIGMRTVNVSKFDVKIASTDGLLLSLNAVDWDTTISINKGNYSTAAYSGNTNNWAGRGLLPMSTIGEMDSSVSRMKLYEKASLTTTPGGYRLMASRVHNYDNSNPEQDGYVVFDLFVRNFSGTQYLEALNPLDEEAIYLTVDSAVTVASTGVADTGLENSVRVAYTQIGRVSGITTNVPKITGITCEPDSETGEPSIIANVTGICRDAQIWEPNDKLHVDDAISWYDTSCVARTGADVTLPASYSGACGAVENGKAYPTYVVNQDITSTNNVDIYDGAAYNKYEGTTKLTNQDFFTDTEKLLTGTSRPTFMTLAPNSITKLRIYIYIEGQDVDNYDFASIGKAISVQFGFSKERFTGNDIEYNGPSLVSGNDTTKPVITLLGEEDVTVTKGSSYTDAGATALDDIDGDITDRIRTINPVNTAVAGEYTITYNVVDWSGNYAAQVTRTVTVTE